MDSQKTIIVTTGIQSHEETQDIHWRIKNFAQVQKDEALIEKQVFEFEMGWSKWKVGLRLDAERTHIVLYYKLLDLKIFDSTINVKITSRMLKDDGSADPDSTQVAEGVLKRFEELIVSRMMFDSEENWNRWIDKEKVLSIYLNFEARQNVEIKTMENNKKLCSHGAFVNDTTNQNL